MNKHDVRKCFWKDSCKWLCVFLLKYLSLKILMGLAFWGVVTCDNNIIWSYYYMIVCTTIEINFFNFKIFLWMYNVDDQTLEWFNSHCSKEFCLHQFFFLFGLFSIFQSWQPITFKPSHIIFLCCIIHIVQF